MNYSKNKPSKNELISFVKSTYGTLSSKNIHECISDFEFEINLYWQDIYQGKNTECAQEIIHDHKSWINQLYLLEESLVKPEEYLRSIN
jgi:hemerythrin superfamily protein